MNEATSTAVAVTRPGARATIAGYTYRSTVDLDAQRAQAPPGADDRPRAGAGDDVDAVSALREERS